MARRMADAVFREYQWLHRFDAHIEPINRLVDTLRASGRGWVPYVPPMYGGVNARLLSVLRDPGPMTHGEKGSGFICMENEDPTAEAVCTHMSEAGIDAEDVVPWNIFPWYINRAPTATEIEAGVPPLWGLIQLLRKLRVIMLHGGSARSGWRKFVRMYPALTSERGIAVIETYHPSRQAFWHPDPAVRERRKEELRESFKRASALLKEAS